MPAAGVVVGGLAATPQRPGAAQAGPDLGLQAGAGTGAVEVGEGAGIDVAGADAQGLDPIEAGGDSPERAGYRAPGVEGPAGTASSTGSGMSWTGSVMRKRPNLDSRYARTRSSVQRITAALAWSRKYAAA